MSGSTTTVPQQATLLVHGVVVVGSQFGVLGRAADGFERQQKTP